MRRTLYFKPFFMICAVLMIAACSDSADDDNVDVSLNKSEMVASPPPIDGLKPDEMAIAAPPEAPAEVPEVKLAAGGASETQKIENLNFRLLNLERQMANLQGGFDKILPPLAEAARGTRNLETAAMTVQQSRSAAKIDPVLLAPASPNTARQNNASGPLAMAPPPPLNTTPEEEFKRQMAVTDSGMLPSSSPEAMLGNVALPDEGLANTEPAAPPPPIAMNANVTAVRVGEHPGKSRIVLDLTGDVPFKYEIDNNERVLLVALPGTGWETLPGKAIKNPIISGYTAQMNQAGDGSVLVIELAAPSKVVSATKMGASGDAGNRIVLDIAPL